MLIGYARVSTQDQNLDLQIDALKKAGCEKIYEERASGAKADRIELQRALADLRKNDVLVVWKIDRLGRSLKHLLNIITDLSARDVQFRSLTDSIDTSTASGRFFFNVMGSLAEMERDLNHERTLAGLAAARKLGRVGGRRKLMTDSKKAAAIKLIAAGTSRKDVAKNLGISIPTLYRHLPADN